MIEIVHNLSLYGIVADKASKEQLDVFKKHRLWIQNLELLWIILVVLGTVLSGVNLLLHLHPFGLEIFNFIYLIIGCACRIIIPFFIAVAVETAWERNQVLHK